MARSAPDVHPPDLAPRAPTPRFVQDIDTLVRARYPLLYLVSWEEQRLDSIFEQLAKTHGKQLLEWSATKGLRRKGGSRAAAPLEIATEPLEMLAAIERLPEPALVVLKDFHPYLSEPRVVRALRELGHALKSTYTTVLLLSPVLQIPVELEKDISVLDVPLPTFLDLAQLLSDIVGVVRQGNRVQVELSRLDAERLVKAAQGLTLTEAENAFAKAIAVDNRLDGSDVAVMIEEKRQAIRKSGLLEYYPAEENLGGVGGLEHLKRWLDARSSAFGEAARKFGLPEPKGVLLLGVQGCGKSLTAKAVAAQWGLPLVRLDMGRIFSGLIGSSEENLRKAIKVAEGVAPCVLWVDEIEKGLAGTGGGDSDGGVAARVFGALLTWLQEKTSPVFVVATANRIDLVPPELLRKGRFDEIFFIDLPSRAERQQIFEIHLRRRGRDPAKFDPAALAEQAAGFSGAEIEQAIVSGMYQAFQAGSELLPSDVEQVLRESCPLSRTMHEEIARLREWARLRTRPASVGDGS
jgi:ATP-dependent 26S proteasome regulatory subunit